MNEHRPVASKDEHSEAHMESETLQESGEPTSATCVHGRLIENVVVRKRTQRGKVRCLECGAVIDDPYEQSKDQ